MFQLNQSIGSLASTIGRLISISLNGMKGLVCFGWDCRLDFVRMKYSVISVGSSIVMQNEFISWTLCFTYQWSIERGERFCLFRLMLLFKCLKDLFWPYLYPIVKQVPKIECPRDQFTFKKEPGCVFFFLCYCGRLFDLLIWFLTSIINYILNGKLGYLILVLQSELWGQVRKPFYRFNPVLSFSGYFIPRLVKLLGCIK